MLLEEKRSVTSPLRLESEVILLNTHVECFTKFSKERLVPEKGDNFFVPCGTDQTRKLGSARPAKSFVGQ